MFTWNFQYVSRVKLAETLNQIRINDEKGDVLVRIHTAIHQKDEAVDLARFIKHIVPKAKIIGTSTSGVIYQGKIYRNQCIVSVTQSDNAKFQSAMIPFIDKENKGMLSGVELCKRTADVLCDENIKLLLTFLSSKYYNACDYVDCCNDKYPNAQMLGGIAISSEAMYENEFSPGFVFDESGSSDEAVLIAAIIGADVDCLTSCAIGAETVGKEFEVSETFGSCILSIDGKDAAELYKKGIGEKLKTDRKLYELFPFAYSDNNNVPVFVGYKEDVSIESYFPKDNPLYAEEYEKHPQVDVSRKRNFLKANHSLRQGRKLKRAFIYDKKVVDDNREMFRKIENFEKSETLFAYSCHLRSRVYPNISRWELSAYTDSNMSGCLTDGEIVTINGRFAFANCVFGLSIFGEKFGVQNYNPYIFSHTEALADDNVRLVDYIIDMESEFKNDDEEKDDNFGMKEFLRECEKKLLTDENESLPNEVALNTDIAARGYDRICMIDITDNSGMKSVFSKQLIDLTYKNYISTCSRFCQEKKFRMYLIDGWHIAIGSPSYKTSLSDFEEEMRLLQKTLFESSREFIAIVPLFCLIDGCTLENMDSAYYKARIEMMNKNIQFFVASPNLDQLDEESIRKKYHMVNVVNYAIAHDKVIPYFQGIYDNKEKQINHYESLMRLEDENGKVYYPAEFLDVARSFGHLYDSLSKKMIAKVFEIFKESEKTSVSINLGIRDIKNPELTEYIFDLMASVKHPENFVFEILENEDIDDYDVMVAFVDRIHALGGKISIDDFGSGYSNLQHLMSVHSDFIKIDGSIVKHCCESEESERLIAIIAGWKSISSRDIAIVAEYVENEGIQEKMTRFGIDYSQGFLFSKPTPEISFE
ncbi:MAG: EAL domain-containing protein [Lachnospiraceae bacterium]|nr:EAL domain-containing protein [Lachnospiraceae bacterium]